MISCHSCRRQYADTASFCPFCGAKPQARGGGGAGSAELIEQDQKTVALDITQFDLPPETPKASKKAAVAPDDAADRTVAMSIPPELLDEPAPKPKGPARKSAKRSGTILGMPGMTPGDASPPGSAAGRAKAAAGGAALKAGLMPQAQGTGGPPPVTTGTGDGLSGVEKTVAFNPADLGIGEPVGMAPPAEVHRQVRPGPGPSTNEPASTVATPVLSAERPQAPAASPAPDFSATVAATRQPVRSGGAAAPPPMQEPAAANRPPAKKKGGGSKIALFAVLGVLLAGGLTTALIMFTGGSSGGPLAAEIKASADKNIPGDVDGLVGLNVEKLRSSWVYDSFKPQIEEAANESRVYRKLSESTEMSLGDINAVTIGVYHRLEAQSDDEETVREGGVAVIKANFDAAKVNTALQQVLARDKKSRQHDVEGTTFYGRKRRAMGAAFDDAIVLTVGDYERAEKVMKTRGGGPAYSANGELMQALSLIDKGAIFFAVATLDASALKNLPDPAREHVKAGDWVAMSVDVDGDIVVRMGVVVDEARAEAAAEQLNALMSQGRGLLQMAPEEIKGVAEEVLDSVSVEASGKTVKISLTLPKRLADMAPTLLQ